MTSDLLKCTICPKKPSFSDVSHLLTHVGSKGHLAHLHSLQVRSHQETDAGTKLTIYNQWYQDHGVAALLSERMQQKEQKQAVKKSANRRRMAASTNASTDTIRKAGTTSRDLQTGLTFPVTKPMVILKSSSLELEDSDSIASRATSQYPVIASSPPNSFIQFKEEDEEYVETIETITKGCLGSPKLKGTQWPGMALFDAASEELKRKRNQKKDGSVVEMLERNAARVQPTETVSSCLGTVLKHRHMDDLENDSPVEGEDVLPEPTPKKRKTTAPRARRQTNIAGNKSSLTARRKQPKTPVKPLSSSTKARPGLALPSSPAEDEDSDFKLVIRRSDRKKKRTNIFSVYADTSASLDVDGSSETASSTYVDTGMLQPQLLFRQPPIIKSQLEAYDPFKMIRDRLPPSVSAFTDVSQDKENFSYPFINSNQNTQARTTANPLYFHRDDGGSDVNDVFRDENLLHSISAASPFAFNEDDHFMPTRNPLMLAVEQFAKREAGEDDHDFDGFATYRRQPLFAP